MNLLGDNSNFEEDEGRRRERRDDQGAGDQPDYDTIIDVSGEQPEFVEREPAPGTFFGRQTGEVRVWVGQSGPRGCLIPVAVVLLLICCSCAGIWILFDNLF